MYVVFVAKESYGNWFWSSFSHQLNGLRFAHLRSVLPLSHENYSIITSPWPIWVLAGLHVMSFNVMTSNNDCNLIPQVGLVGASKVFNARLKFSCNLRKKVWTPALIFSICRFLITVIFGFVQHRQKNKIKIVQKYKNNDILSNVHCLLWFGHLTL